MQPITKRSPTSDDEDDLESLRLAALQSLKRPAVSTGNGTTAIQAAPKLCNPNTFSGKGLNKRGRGYHGGGRSARNGAFNNRIRNSNLISVPTIEAEQSHEAPVDLNRTKKFSIKAPPKLILPQDRYCNIKPSTESKASEASSKFDRYNDSDNSDSESESEDEKTSERESPKKLERVNSLEALMKELENEIHGESKPSGEIPSKPKLKLKKSRKAKEVDSSEVSVVESSDELCPSETEAKPEVDSAERNSVEDEAETSENNNIERVQVEKAPENLPLKVEAAIRRKSKSPVVPNLKRPPLENRIALNPVITQPIPNLPYINSNIAVATPLLPFQAMPYSNFGVRINHGVPFEPPVHYNYSNIPSIGCPTDISSSPQMFSPNRYERPMSPLTIKTNILNTITAPLSPRSAAFVLQNREIIERRKKSPRRSYSRSPSPEFRRSVSPRYRRSNSRPSRSPSPTRQRLSPNRRTSPSRRASPSSRRTSPSTRRLSPCSQPSSRRQSPTINRYRASPPKRLSPNGRSSPKWSRRSPLRSNVRNRLGAPSAAQSHNKPEAIDEPERKTRKRSRSISLSLSPSPERFSLTNSPVNREQDQDGQLDAVLEARRRKFENGAVPTAGIIRLKPKLSDEDEAFLSSENGEDQKSEHQVDTNEDEDINEEQLLGTEDTYIDFNVRVDDLFSDEESDNENEGRFKSNRQQAAAARGVTVVPFTQLLNGASNNKGEAGLKEKRSHDRDRERRDRSRYQRRSDRDRGAEGPVKNAPEKNKYKDDRDRDKNRNRPVDRARSRSPLRSRTRDATEDKQKSENAEKSTSSSSSTKSSSESIKKEPSVSEKRPLKSLLSVKVDVKPERRKPPIVSPIENKKIEIKIRNPAKYEVESRGHDGAGKTKAEDTAKEKKSSSRKVEVASDPVVDEPEEGEFDEPDPEVIVDNEEDEDEDLINKNEGDLRAQLSRKRAERQNKLPKAEGVPSRLLQSALQGAVFKKTKKSKSKKKEKEAAPVDGKLPIHLRLGIPGNLDIFTDSKPHKKTSRKRSKNRGNFEQV